MELKASAALAEFTQRKTAYQLVFGAMNKAAATAVLADLGLFCRAKHTCVVPGDRDRTNVLEGRREVWLRIQDYLELSPEELVGKYTTLKGDVNDD